MTSPAVPPYSSTTIAHCVCCTWNCFSSSGTSLVSGTTTAGRMSAAIGRLSSARPSATRSLMKTNPAMLSRLSLNTGKREYSCSRNSARSRQSSAVSGMATMSGRGVITSRTSVSPKSTMLCSSRRLASFTFLRSRRWRAARRDRHRRRAARPLDGGDRHGRPAHGHPLRDPSRERRQNACDWARTSAAADRAAIRDRGR